MQKKISLLIGLSLCTSASAAILLESVDDDGKVGRVTIEEGRARIDADSLGGYILVNLEEGSIFAVNHKERALMDLRSPRISPHGKIKNSKSTQPGITFKKVGKGPAIAGYETNRYKVSIDGMYCFDEYLSEQLLTNKNIKRFVEIIGESSGSDDESGMGIPFDPAAPCESADDLADDFYVKLGIPMRTVGSNGLVTHEITRVDFNLTPPAGTFTAPPGYSQVSRQALIDRHSRNNSAQPDVGNLNNAEILKMQKQIKKQIEDMKQRHTNTLK